MASNPESPAKFFTLLSYVILVASLAHACLGGSSSESVITDLSLISTEKVKLELYYETLCPFSAKFIAEQLPRIFDNGLIDIITLQLVPWGNAVVRPNKTFECQHGTYECKLNTIHACAIAFWPNVKEHFRFIHCVENLIYEGNYTQWETCFEALALDPKPILDCYSGGYGSKLELMCAVRTAALQPPHQYVPWVVVDQKPLFEDYDNFIHYVCKAYKGTLPGACNHLALESAPNKADHIHPYPVCYSHPDKNA